jgi:hypothetical protein
MWWKQEWSPSAKARWRALAEPAHSALAKGIEKYIRGAAEDEPSGHIQVGEWWVVAWVISLHITKPDDVEEDDLWIFDVSEDDD